MQRTLPRLTLGGLETAFHTQFLKMKWQLTSGRTSRTLRTLSWRPEYMQTEEGRLLGFIKMTLGIGIGREEIQPNHSWPRLLKIMHKHIPIS